MTEPRLYNLHRDRDIPSTAVYIGRRRLGMHYGNPFTHLTGGTATTAADLVVPTRLFAVACYDAWLTESRDVLNRNLVAAGVLPPFDSTGHRIPDTVRAWLATLERLEPRRLWVLEHLPNLRGRHLSCFCAPAACHGTVLLRLANAPTPSPP